MCAIPQLVLAPLNPIFDSMQLPKLVSCLARLHNNQVGLLSMNSYTGRNRESRLNNEIINSEILLGNFSGQMVMTELGVIY